MIQRVHEVLGSFAALKKPSTAEAASAFRAGIVKARARGDLHAASEMEGFLAQVG